MGRSNEDDPARDRSSGHHPQLVGLEGKARVSVRCSCGYQPTGPDPEDELAIHLAAYLVTRASSGTMVARLQALLASMEQYKHLEFWAAELRSAITGRKYLYRCPMHGDRKLSSIRAERGVCCGEPFRGDLGCCSATARLVGEVDAP